MQQPYASDYADYPPPRRENNLLWIAVGVVAAIGVCALIVCGGAALYLYIQPPASTRIPVTVTLTPSISLTAGTASSTSISSTLLPTPTSPPVATTQAASANCPIPVSGLFAGLWQTYHDTLGCPAYSSLREIADAEQLFQNGHMFWRADADIYYVVYDGGGLSAGSWAQYAGNYATGGLSKCPEQPPVGLFKPEHGFGNVWCALGGAKAGIGWARDREYGFGNGQGVIRVQDFERGVIFQDSDGVQRNLAYILFSDGRFIRIRP